MTRKAIINRTDGPGRACWVFFEGRALIKVDFRQVGSFCPPSGGHRPIEGGSSERANERRFLAPDGAARPMVDARRRGDEIRVIGAIKPKLYALVARRGIA